MFSFFFCLPACVVRIAAIFSLASPREHFGDCNEDPSLDKSLKHSRPWKARFGLPESTEDTKNGYGQECGCILKCGECMWVAGMTKAQQLCLSLLGRADTVLPPMAGNKPVASERVRVLFLIKQLAVEPASRPSLPRKSESWKTDHASASLLGMPFIPPGPTKSPDLAVLGQLTAAHSHASEPLLDLHT